MTRRVSEEPESVADLSLPAATVREREQERQRGGPRGKKAGKAGSPGQPPMGPRPRHVGSRPWCCRSVHWLVGRLVGGLVACSSAIGSQVRRWEGHRSGPHT